MHLSMATAFHCLQNKGKIILKLLPKIYTTPNHIFPFSLCTNTQLVHSVLRLWIWMRRGLLISEGHPQRQLCLILKTILNQCFKPLGQHVPVEDKQHD